MNKLLKTFIGVSLLALLFIFACQNKTENSDTILTGEANIYVDESIKPIVEDAKAVFETQYKAKLNIISKSEAELMNSLFDGSARIVVLSKKINQENINILKTRKIKPRVTPFAKDAIALIKNKASNDTLVSLQDVVDFMKGKPVTSIKGLVFDNPNSSSVRLISEIANVNFAPEKNIFSFKTSEEVIKYVSENNGMIGVVGIDWIFQPELINQKYVDNVNIMSVKGVNATEYVFPSQDNLAQGKYPLARDLYIIDCQGYSGLGMGFSSFVAGERGQRIVLKSGLVPVRFPTRRIVIKK